MNYLFHDRLNSDPHVNITTPSVDFPGFVQFVKVLQAKYCKNADELPEHDAFIAFIHAGDSQTQWTDKANPEKNQWIVLVSRGGPTGLSSNVRGVRCVTSSLDQVMSRLKKTPHLVAAFRKSCEGGDGPNVSLLLGRWPERVLASYLLATADMTIDQAELRSVGLEKTAVQSEYAQYCIDYGLHPKKCVSKENLKTLLLKMAEPNVR